MWSLKRRVVVTSILLALMLAFMSFFLIRQIRNILWKRTELFTVQLIEKVAYDIDMLIGTLDRAASHLAYDSSIMNLLEGKTTESDVERVNEALNQTFHSLPEAVKPAAILVISKNMEILASTNPDLKGRYRILGVEWITKVMASKNESVKITGYSIAQGIPLSNSWVINIARGVFIDDVYVGMIMLDIPTQALEAISNQIDIGENGFVSLIDEDNLVLFSTNWVDMGNQFKRLFLPNHDEKSFIAEIDGESVFIVPSFSDFSGITVLGALPLKSVFAPVQRLSKNIIIGVVLFGVLFIVVSLSMVLSLTNPILQLVKKMKEVEHGDLSIRVSSHRNDEFGFLEKGFNTMLDQVQDLIDREYAATLREREAQLNELTAIINPHFIYNTLEVIKMRAYLNNDEQVVEMLSQLARLFRIMTNRTSRLIPLREELEHCTIYLGVMAYKGEPEISVNIDISEDICDLYTLKFLLQPLVENSIIHGLHNKNFGSISISARQQDGSLRLVVTDDGEGFTPERLQSIQSLLDGKKNKKQRASALLNIHERIHLAFGSAYGLSILDTGLHGTSMEIHIPVLRTEQGEAE